LKPCIRFYSAMLIFAAFTGRATVVFAQESQGSLLRAEANRIMLSELRPVLGTTTQKLLSEYLPSLAGSPGDSPVYIMEGAQPGGTAFICAGTHGNEIAGVVAAALLAEQVNVLSGRVIILPRANRSAASYPDPDRPGPPSIRIATPGGDRIFAYGARRTWPGDEGRPDPLSFSHPDSRLPPLDGNESRNLDRNYPGSAEGGLTARVAYAIENLIKTENVDIAFDLHEANPESKLAWIIVANPKNVDIAAIAALELEGKGVRMALDMSAEEPRGLSHREWGDRTKARAFLIETPNPAQVYPPLHGDPVNDPALPLSRRVAVQLCSIVEIIAAYNDETSPESRVLLENIPSPDEIEARGLGGFLD